MENNYGKKKSVFNFHWSEPTGSNSRILLEFTIGRPAIDPSRHVTVTRVEFANDSSLESAIINYNRMVVMESVV